MRWVRAPQKQPSSSANREGAYQIERLLTGVLVIGMALTAGYGILRLRQMQTDFVLRSPPKESK